MEHDGKTYEESLQNTRSFFNPSATEHLAQSVGLDFTSNCSHSLLKALKYNSLSRCSHDIKSVTVLISFCVQRSHRR